MQSLWPVCTGPDRATPLAGWAAAALLAACAACAVPPDRAAEVSADPASLYAFHGEPGAWFTPWRPRDISFLDMLRWLVSRNAYSGEWRDPPDVPRVENDGSSLAVAHEAAALTWVGHSTFAVHDRADVFLTDPHFGPRALLPKRHHPPGIPLHAIPADAFALVSHNHYDHLDAYTVETLPPSVWWFVPMGLAEWFRDRDRPNVVELDWWQTVRHGRWTISCVPSQHWSLRIGQAENSTLWCAWVIASDERRYFFGGDTGYFHGFREIARRYGPIDVALLPIGAYEPRWFMRYSHMNPAEAYRAFQDLEARWMIPCHWGTFDLTDEPYDEAPRELRRVVRAAGASLEAVKIMAIGERWQLPAE